MNRVFSTAVAGTFALAVCACSAAPAQSVARTEADNAAPAGSCDAASLGWAIGQVADDALVERARTESHSTSVRVLRPGMMVTREFNGARLNLRVDNERKVLATNCG